MPPEIEVERTRDINFLFELPKEYGGKYVRDPSNDKKDSMMTFDIRTGQKLAKEQFEKKSAEKEKK